MVKSLLTAGSGDAELPELPGIASADFLARMKGNVARCRKLLLAFRREYPDFATRARKALAEGDWESAQRLAHTLKGGAGTIAAYALRDAALNAENTCRDRSEIAAGAALAEMEKELAAVCRSLATLETPPPPVAASGQASPQSDDAT